MKMLRAVSRIYEYPSLELLAVCRRDAVKIISRGVSSTPTVLSSEPRPTDDARRPPAGGGDAGPSAPSGGPEPPDGARSRRLWSAAAAVALTASIGGVFFFKRKLNKEEPHEAEPAPSSAVVRRWPATAKELPANVDYLLVGGGTASFAALRAVRAARPLASVLVAGAEPLPPYMRPPLSKEVWADADALASGDAEQLTFRQWNGRRRHLLYEPRAFYQPPPAAGDDDAAALGGTTAAFGWRVVALDVDKKEAVLEPSEGGGERGVVKWRRALLGVGSVPRRLEALREAAAEGRSMTVRSVEDCARLATLLRGDVRRVAIVGGGHLGTELAASLAAHLGGRAEVCLVFRGATVLRHVLPAHLAGEVTRRLRRAGVRLEANTTLAAAHPAPRGVQLTLSDGRALHADLVLECVGVEPDLNLARDARLETDERGVLVSAELSARAGVWAAGDAASWWDTGVGRRRAHTSHDHAVSSGRAAGHNMAGDIDAQQPYTHQPMLWSDIAPDLSYEAVGEIDATLPTYSVFADDAVSEEAAAEATSTAASEATSAATSGASSAAASGATLTAASGATSTATSGATSAASSGSPGGLRYERGVVLYLRERRVVGVLLWNIFNKINTARQVLAQGEFEDLFEVAKLFTQEVEEEE